MNRKILKGYAFEYFVRRLLVNCGFEQVQPKGDIIYSNGTGLMIQGLGQSHNADVLVSPPIQMPFYYPSRLLIECKCRKDPVGLPTVRGVFGLREDINNFEIVTPQMLQQRRNARRVGTGLQLENRYYYQVALASNSSFKSTAQEFAAVHRIPLLSFSSSIFATINALIGELDQPSFLDEDRRVLTEFFRNDCIEGRRTEHFDRDCAAWVSRFREEVSVFASRVRFGVLENGTMLFLIREESTHCEFDSPYQDGFELHWSGEGKYWELTNNSNVYQFELPIELMNAWANATGDTREERARNLKQEYFKKIAVFHMDADMPQINIIKISAEFIRSMLCQRNDDDY
jgi:hypothetical protein